MIETIQEVNANANWWGIYAGKASYPGVNVVDRRSRDSYGETIYQIIFEYDGELYLKTGYSSSYDDEYINFYSGNRVVKVERVEKTIVEYVPIDN